MRGGCESPRTLCVGFIEIDNHPKSTEALMLNVRGWIGVVSAPVLLSSVGCSIGPRSMTASHHGIPPERMMSMARTFERQGHFSQAKSIYQQVIASQPNYPNARTNLDTLIAAEMGRNGNPALIGNPLQSAAPQPMLAVAPRQSVPAMPTAIRSMTSKSAASTEVAQVAQSSAPQMLTADEPQANADLVTADTTHDDLISIGSPESQIVADRDSGEMSEYFSPADQDEVAATVGLEQFLGPFHIEMVRYLKANREQFQSRLVVLASSRSASSETRTRAVFLLGTIGREAAETVPVLRQEMRGDSDGFLKVDLAEAILKILPEDEEAIRVLIGCLKDADRNLKLTAAFALRNAVSPRTAFVIDALCESLTTEDLKLRRMLFLILAEFGPAAEKVIPELEAALESDDAATREVAKASLECIAPDRRAAKSQSTIKLWELALNN